MGSLSFCRAPAPSRGPPFFQGTVQGPALIGLEPLAMNEPLRSERTSPTPEIRLGPHFFGLVAWGAPKTIPSQVVIITTGIHSEYLM